MKGNVIINNYKLFVSRGHRAFVEAINQETNEVLTLFDCGTPDSEAEFFAILKSKLDAIEGGKRKSRRNRKSKKSRKGRKIRKRSSRRTRK